MQNWWRAQIESLYMPLAVLPPFVCFRRTHVQVDWMQHPMCLSEGSLCHWPSNLTFLRAERKARSEILF